MDLRKLKKVFKLFVDKAQDLTSDKNKTLHKVTQTFNKATENKDALKEVWEKLQLLIGLSVDYTNGTYNNVDRKTIATIIGGLLYFLSPIDLIPDFILGLGLIDDIFIIGYVYKKVAKELDKYQDWKEQQKITIHI